MPKDPGLGMGLKPENYKPKGPTESTELKRFFHTLVAELLEYIMKDAVPQSEMDGKLNDFFDDLKHLGKDIVALKDKTNGHHLVALNSYVYWVNDHMQKVAISTKR
eukprot:14175435-Ditylum_brightwellii.AAC.1